MTQGRAVVARQAHNLEVMGSIPIPAIGDHRYGAVAQSGERDFCKVEATSSSLVSSTQEVTSAKI